MPIDGDRLIDEQHRSDGSKADMHAEINESAGNRKYDILVRRTVKQAAMEQEITALNDVREIQLLGLKGGMEACEMLSFIVNNQTVAIDGNTIRMLRQQYQLTLKFVSKPVIIAIQMRNELPLRPAYEEAQIAAGTEILRMEKYFYPIRMAFRQRHEDLARFIGRSIIPNQNLNFKIAFLI